MASSSSDWPIHQLWPPPDGRQRMELDLVFFHGLQLTENYTGDSWSTTWTQRWNNDVCWPEKWLPFDLGEAVRIFSVSYNAHILSSLHGHVSEIAHNLLQNLMDHRYEWRHLIVLISHSFGGLVLKSLVVKLKTMKSAGDSYWKATAKRGKAFLRNVRGVAFYAVPHAGSSNISKYLNKLLRCSNRRYLGILDNTLPGQRDMEQLSVDFENIVNENEINIYAFCEGRPMNVGVLVDFISAQRLARNNHYMVEDANHMEVCRPPSKEHPSYCLLLQLIKSCQKVGGECHQTFQEVHALPQSMFGLKSYVERLETVVTSQGRHAASQYVGVFGMGGVGKTLLLQTVYQSAKIHGHFQGAKFIWRTVGENPDIMVLYRSLSEELNLKLQANVKAEDYKLKLHSDFIRRRIFLVLDDVWNVEAFDSLDLAKGDGSVTLVTTRIQSLLERASPDICKVHMSPLSPEDGWSLFCAHAFKQPSNVPRQLKALAQSMAEECQGLPLALKVIGGAMFGKTSPELQWEPLLKNLRESRMQHRTVEVNLYERLKLGYDLLSEDDSRLKDCFLYFAAFPEDSMIYFKSILWHWIGMGWVPGNVGDDRRADAFSLLDKLRERCFIVSHGSVCSEERGLLYFTIHDVMRDLAFYILVKDNGIPPLKDIYLYRAGQNLKEFPQEWKFKPEASILSLEKNRLWTLPCKIDAPELLSLLLGNNPFDNPGKFLSCFPKLRILNLSLGEFSELPEAIGDLKNLVWLDVQRCAYLRTLPDAVRKLHLLKHLDVRSCRSLMKLPSGIVHLTSLQVLSTTNCVELRWAVPTQAGRMDEFLNRLAHTPSDSVHEILNPTYTASLEDVCSMVSLTELRMSDLIYPRQMFPNNISTLSKLKLLHLRLLHIETLPAGMAYWFMQLEVLHLYDSECMQTFPSSFTSRNAFPALTNFELHHCSKFVQFPKVEKNALPKLQTLKFYFCDKLQSLPLSLDLLISLRKLTLVHCGYTLSDSCRRNCGKSPIWKNFVIIYDL